MNQQKSVTVIVLEGVDSSSFVQEIQARFAPAPEPKAPTPVVKVKKRHLNPNAVSLTADLVRRQQGDPVDTALLRSLFAKQGENITIGAANKRLTKAASLGLIERIDVSNFRALTA